MAKHVDSGTKSAPRLVAASHRLKVQQWEIGRLVEYPNNPRDNDHAVARMSDTIRKFGFRIPIVATSDGEVVDGHLRLKAARSLGLKEVPVALADDLDERQIKAFRIVANQSSAWANWNAELLKVELQELENLKFDLHEIGLDNIELPELESVPPPKPHRNKTTLFISIRNEEVEKARKTIIAALDRARIPHNL